MILHLKRFVMNGFSMTVYVNVANFCLVWCFFSWFWWDGLDFRGSIGKGLLCITKLYISFQFCTLIIRNTNSPKWLNQTKMRSR